MSKQFHTIAMFIPATLKAKFASLKIGFKIHGRPRQIMADQGIPSIGDICSATCISDDVFDFQSGPTWLLEVPERK